MLDLNALINFQKEINKDIVYCYENMNTGSSDKDIQKFFKQIMSYYNRMKNMYMYPNQNDDDELFDDDDECLDDNVDEKYIRDKTLGLYDMFDDREYSNNSTKYNNKNDISNNINYLNNNRGTYTTNSTETDQSRYEYLDLYNYKSDDNLNRSTNIQKKYVNASSDENNYIFKNDLHILNNNNNSIKPFTSNNNIKFINKDTINDDTNYDDPSFLF